MRRRRSVLALVLALVLLGAAPAAAHWSAGGGGAGQAPVATLPDGPQPTATAAAQNVTVEWMQVAFGGSPLGSYTGGGYRVWRYPAGGGTKAAPSADCDVVVSGTSATLSCREDDVPAGSWRYTVATVLGSWTGAESPASAAVDVAPVAPSLTAATAQNPPAGQATGAISLDWGAVTGATGYNVYRRTSSGSYNFSAPLNGTVPLTATTFTDDGTGLSGATTYAYVVRAVTGTITSASSNERSATPITRPSPPSSVTATPAAGGTIGVSWPSVSDATGYNVYRRTSAGAYDYAAPLNGATPSTGTNWTDTTTTDGAGYRYVIRAVKTGAGGVSLESADSPESALATADATSPASVSLTDPGSPLRASVTLSGSATDPGGSGVASLRFEYAPAGGSTWSTGCTATTAPYTCNLATTAISDGLYDLRVVATDVAGNTTTSSSVLNRRIDNTAPTTTLADPGAYLRATITLSATASDAGSGVVSMRIQRAPTGTATWTDVCTGTTATLSCALNTTTLTDGSYDLRALATDAAGNVSTPTPLVNRIVDNTAPTGVDIQTTNAPGGTPAKPESGDTITYSFSEPMRPVSLLAGWSGAAIAVTVRFTNGNPDVVTVFDSSNTTQVALGSFTSGKKYVTGNTSFTASSMTLSGSTVTVTLGTASGTTATANGATTLQWSTSTATTDLAGNPLTAATIPETGAADQDF